MFKEKKVPAFFLHLLLGCALALGLAASVHGARVPAKGPGQDVVVLCVKFNADVPGRTCSEWVQRLDDVVGTWYEENTHGVTSFDFRLPTTHAGMSLPADGWLPVTLAPGQGVFVNNISDNILPAVDPTVDFSQTDRLLIVGSSQTFFGQAAGGSGPGQANLSHRAFLVDEHGDEEIWMLEDGTEERRRRMAVAMLWEGRFWDPNSNPGTFIDPATQMIESEAIAIHEISHWLGLPDRYGSFISFPNNLTIGDTYSLMGNTWWERAVAHWFGEARYDLGFLFNNRVPLNLTAGASGTYHLIPGFMPSNIANEHPLIRIPLQASGPFQGYVLEARQENYRSWPSRPAVLADRVPEEGVVITWVNESRWEAAYQIALLQDPDDPGTTTAALEVGDVYEDPAQGVRIEVVGERYEGYDVQIDVVQPGDMRADPAIEPWDTTRWETTDIWVDNQINGYGTLEFTKPDGTADGNGDRPEPEQENRIYFRLRNYGLETAKNVQATVKVAFPGAGDAGPRWSVLGQVLLPSIASQGEVESFVNWTPPADHGGHACIKVEILPLPNETEPGNNSAQENVFEFESTRNSPWRSQAQVLEIHNPFDDRDIEVTMDVQNLPDEWAVSLYPETFTLAPLAAEMVHFELHPAGSPGQPSSGYEEGQIFNVGVIAYGLTPQGDDVILGGVNALTQLKHRMELTLKILDPTASGAEVGGCLNHAVGGATIAIAITKPSGLKVIDHATADASGCYSYSFEGYSGTWILEALYDGVGVWGSARSLPLKVVVP